jgi:hypothetical protein
LNREGVPVEQLWFRYLKLKPMSVRAKEKSEIVAAILKALGDSDAVGGFIYKNNKLSGSFLIKEDECLQMKDQITSKFFGIEIDEAPVNTKNF